MSKASVSKNVSFYDWELNFRNKSTLTESSNIKKYSAIKKKEVNSLGISDIDFQDFMKKWKEKNLS